MRTSIRGIARPGITLTVSLCAALSGCIGELEEPEDEGDDLSADLVSAVATFEAGSGSIRAPFVIVNGALRQPATSMAVDASSGSAIYAFTVTAAGDYTLDAVVNAANLSQNSFFINVDTQPNPSMIWDIAPTSGFQTRTASWRGSGNSAGDPTLAQPKVFKLTAGQHRLFVRGREGGTQVRRFTFVTRTPDTKEDPTTPLPSSDPPTSSNPTVCGVCFYVRAGATGNGSDWANAYPQLPATLQRGAVYFVAGGSYPSYTFNTPVAGTALVTVKKASPSDHGTDVGWQQSYGTLQAAFATRINVFKGFFVLDGQYRNETDWFDGASYGFKIQSNNSWQEIVIRDAGIRPISTVTIKHVYIASVVGRLPVAGSGTRPFSIDTDTYNSTFTNTNGVFSRIYIEGGNNPFMVRGFANPIVEYSASSKTCGDANFHGENVNLFYTHAGGGIVRYNHFRDAYNGASGYRAGGGTGVIAIAETSGVQIYGNIFENYMVGDGAIAAGWSNSNIKVHNNTFINGTTYGPPVRFPVAGEVGSGNEAYNNLIVNSTQSSNGQGTFANNYTETSSVFVNALAHDFRLARATVGGRVLPTPFNVDRAGRPRGTDGVWDVGAYEYAP